MWRLLTIGVAILVGILGALVAISPSMPMVVAAGIVGLLAFYNRPKFALIVWLVALAFIPYWFGINAVGYVPAASAIGIAILVASLFNGQWRISKGDLPIVLLIVVGFIAVIAGSSNQGVWLSMMTQWLLAYLVGKTIVRAAGLSFSVKAVALVFGLVGALAIAELVFSWHPFTNLAMSNPAYAAWSPIQVRGGLDRSEWAMGHSIALGGALSAAVAFVLRSSVRGSVKSLLLLLLFAGIACTFSRAAIVSAVLTLALSLIFMRSLKAGYRFVLLMLAAAAGFVGMQVLTPIFELASGETAGSSSYRERMLAELVPQLSFVGRSSAAVETGGGYVRYGSFQSIDSTFLGIGLSFGWCAAVIMLIPFVVMIARLLRRTATTAEIALVGQLPMLFTVALITQYQLVLWFFAGMAVAEAHKTFDERKSEVINPAKDQRISH